MINRSKCVETLIKLLYSTIKRDILLDENTKISELLNEYITSNDWIKIIIKLELLLSINIPKETINRIELTPREFIDSISEIPMIPDAFYPEFYKIKIKQLKSL